MQEQIDKLLASSHTFKDVFEANKEHKNHKYIFIYEKDGKTVNVSYNEFFDNCFKYAAQFKKELANIETGSYVAYKLTNSPVWGYVFWGLLITGYNPVIINPMYSTNDTNKLVKESGAKFIFNQKEEVLDIPSKLISEISITDEKFEADVWGTKIAFCTSGTTGDSKVFVYTDENIPSQWRAYRIRTPS